MASSSPARVLIFGATGYVGKYIARASLKAGHPTFLFVRPDVAFDIAKSQLLLSLKRDGAILLKGSFEDQKSIIDAVKQAEIVIAALGEKALLEQLKIIEAMKEVGMTKRYYPSEYGMDPDHTSLVKCPSPIGDAFKDKREIRRAIESMGIPYTYVSANCLNGFFLSGLGQIGQFMPPSDKVVIYGDGNTKVVWNSEEDVANYVIQSIQDPRAVNKTLYVCPPSNLFSINEVISIWENLSGTSLQKTHISESKWLQDTNEVSSTSLKIAMGHLHLLFYLGVCCDFEIEAGVETSHLYPQVDYKKVASYLQNFV